MDKVFGVPISEQSIVQIARQLTAEPVPTNAGLRLVCTINLDHVVNLRRSARFRDAYAKAWMVTVDGTPVFLYAKMIGAHPIERVTGSDLFIQILNLLPRRECRLFFVVSSHQTEAGIVRKLLSQGFERDRVAFDIPEFGFEKSEAQSERLAQRIREFQPTHIFFGVGSPKSEVWLAERVDQLGDAYAFGFGAGLDFYAGTARRAPLVFRNLGLEWFWRFTLQPKRLFRRYFIDSRYFVGAVIDDWRSRH
ncbi:WecB/TagA/CpsF family glycosyltransferase [Bosea sp. PAMC 26642]|uniref:WecB/TagA/CpsF family glycosyltransferase n=1 Tax=Bosea sp. (strain PAMC 26642) TaxID=1792307 RepID=UPI0014389E4E|nr:WecB/TagA/CpsF family glycosyltransferase [Bosea sp. PAMC 26642]